MVLRFLCIELQLVQDSLKQSLLESILFRFLQSLINLLLDFVNILFLYSLNTNRECGLASRVIITIARTVGWSVSFFDESLVEKSIGPFE